MFSSLSLPKIVLHKRNLLSSLKIYPLSLIRFISTDSKDHQKSFTISYLINSCGLSPQKAISAAKKINIKSSLNPDSVLTLLRNYGFSDSHISKITATYPQILLRADNNLKPKFEFFSSKGLSGTDIVKVLSREKVMGKSLEKNIIPSFDFLKSIVGTDEKVIAMLKRNTNAIGKTKTIATNVALLRAHDVPDSNTVKLLISQPRALMAGVSRFGEIVKEVKEMEFDPLLYMFLLAVHVLSSMSKSSLEAKFGVYKSWGLSEDQVQCAFRKFPYCMILSQENIMSKMDYFVNKMGYDSSYFVKAPNMLQYSLERIVPRCSVIQLLYTTGQVKEPPSLHSFLPISDVKFFKKYLTKYEKEVPELMNAYQKKAR